MMGKTWPGWTLSSGAGLDDVVRTGVSRHRRLDRQRAVLRRDAGGHSGRRFDRDRERRTVRALVVARHLRQPELAAACLGERQADQSAAEAGHEVDCLGSDVLGSQDQITFVLAILLVDQDNHAPAAHFDDNLLD